MQDKDIRTHETNRSYSKSVFQVLIQGTNPFNYMPQTGFLFSTVKSLKSW